MGAFKRARVKIAQSTGLILSFLVLVNVAKLGLNAELNLLLVNRFWWLFFFKFVVITHVIKLEEEVVLFVPDLSAIAVLLEARIETDFLRLELHAILIASLLLLLSKEQIHGILELIYLVDGQLGLLAGSLNHLVSHSATRIFGAWTVDCASMVVRVVA